MFVGGPMPNALLQAIVDAVRGHVTTAAALTGEGIWRLEPPLVIEGDRVDFRINAAADEMLVPMRGEPDELTSIIRDLAETPCEP